MQRCRALREARRRQQIDQPWPRGKELGEKLRGGADPDQRCERGARGRAAESLIARRQRADGSGERAVRIGARRAEVEQRPGIVRRKPRFGRDPRRQGRGPLGVFPGGRRLRFGLFVHSESISPAGELPGPICVAMLNI